MTASSTGTATGMEDLLSRIITFLTTDATLVANSQQWTVLRLQRDTLASLNTNFTQQTTAAPRKVIHGCRYENRSLNTDSLSDSDSYIIGQNFLSGSSYISWELRTATEIAEIKLRAPNGNSSALSNMIRNFRLQYSDTGLDGSWTTALTVNSNPVYTHNEIKTFAVPASGAHLHWRILVDSISSGTTAYWRSILLMDSLGDVANHFGSEVIFQAPGNDGLSEIYTGIRTEYDAANGWYNFFLNGFTGYDPNQDFFDQPGALPGDGSPEPMEVSMVPLWDAAMPYWLSANGRSFKFAAKVSSSYEAGYLGFILPYATPSQFPYPLAVGGSLIPANTLRGPEWRYSYNYFRHSMFVTPAIDSSTKTQDAATLYLRLPEGEWRAFGSRNTVSNPDTITPITVLNTPPYLLNGMISAVYPTGVLDVSTVSNGRLADRECLNGGYVMDSCILFTRLPSAQVYGELDGIKVISGFNNAAENTTVYNSINHVILQNIARTGVHEYWALALP